ENILRAQTATVLTKATVYLGCIFFGATLLLTVLTAKQSAGRRVGLLENEVRKATPAASPDKAVSPIASATVQASVSPTVSSSPEASRSVSSTPAPSPAATADSSSAPAAAEKSNPSPKP